MCSVTDGYAVQTLEMVFILYEVWVSHGYTCPYGVGAKKLYLAPVSTDKLQTDYVSYVW